MTRSTVSVCNYISNNYFFYSSSLYESLTTVYLIDKSLNQFLVLHRGVVPVNRIPYIYYIFQPFIWKIHYHTSHSLNKLLFELAHACSYYNFPNISVELEKKATAAVTNYKSNTGHTAMHARVWSTYRVSERTNEPVCVCTCNRKTWENGGEEKL